MRQKRSGARRVAPWRRDFRSLRGPATLQNPFHKVWCPLVGTPHYIAPIRSDATFEDVGRSAVRQRSRPANPAEYMGPPR
jgi:hypothetical protein